MELLVYQSDGDCAYLAVQILESTLLIQKEYDVEANRKEVIAACNTMLAYYKEYAGSRVP
jgi:hypothetical protein